MPRGRPPLPKDRKAVKRMFTLYQDDVARLSNLAETLEQSESETVREALEVLDDKVNGDDAG